MKWLPRLRRKLYNRGLVPVLCLSFSLLSLSLSSFFIFYFTMTLSVLASTSAVTKEPEPVIAKEAKGLAPSVQTTEA